MKKYTRSFVLGGVGGFLIAVFLLAQEIELPFDTKIEWLVGGSVAVAAAVFGIAFVRLQRLKKAVATKGMQVEEDERDRWIAIQSSHIADWLMGGLISSLFTFGVSAMYYEWTPTWLIFGLGAYFLFQLVYIRVAMKQLLLLSHPDIDIPEDLNVLPLMDEGEKFVMYEGMMKAYQVMSQLLLLSIILTIMYGAWTNTTQLFPILLMSFIYLIGHGAYQKTYRHLQY